MNRYFTQLHDFASKLPLEIYETLSSSLHYHLPQSHKDLIPQPINSKYQAESVIEQNTIFQTDKELNDEALNNADLWLDLNKGWKVDFFTDQDMQQFVDENFGKSEIGWAWEFMSRGVLKADFWRYLIPLVRGGVYTDVDVSLFQYSFFFLCSRLIFPSFVTPFPPFYFLSFFPYPRHFTLAFKR